METNTILTKIRYNYLSLGFLLIVIFVLLRPLTLAVPSVFLETYKILDFFSIVFSYLFLILILFNLKTIKLDKVTFFILLYCTYVAFSFLWGSSAREIGRMILPLVVFFYVRTNLIDEQRLKIMIAALVIGYIYPIAGSFLSILTGTAPYELVWHAGVTKTQGILSDVHPYAHAMLVFSFLYAIFTCVIGKNRIKLRIALFIMLILSLFCLYKSGVRTVYLGLLIFWGFYLLITNRKYFIIFISAVLCFIAINTLHLEKVFWQTENPKERSIDSASSGRITIWKNNLSIYDKGYSIGQKIFGIGLGKEGRQARYNFKEPHVRSSHNDYLSVFLLLGPFGLILYLIIYVVLICDIFYSSIEWKLRSVFIGVLFSVIAMNFVSNSYIVRVELAQYFWLFIGIFYALNDTTKELEKAGTKRIS